MTRSRAPSSRRRRSTPGGSRSMPRPSRVGSGRIKWAALGGLLGIYYVAPWLRWDRGPGAPNQAVLADMAGGEAVFLRHRDLAAGDLLPDRPADAGRLRPVPRHLAVRPALVRLRLPADGLDRPVHAGGALDRGRPAPSGYASTRRRGPRQMAQAAPQACGLAADRLADRRRLDHVFPRRADRGAASSSPGRRGSPSISSSSCSRPPPICWPAWRASRSAPTCARGRASRALVDHDTWRSPTRLARRAARQVPQGRGLRTGRGDCIDCKQCVAVCPTGIDIRDGFQLECIGCGLCIDACDEVMGRIGRPRG